MATVTIRKGTSPVRTMRWMQAVYGYVTGATLNASAPCTITAPTHGLPNGWLVAIQNATGGFSSLAASNPPKPTEFRRVRVIDGDTLELNDLNAVGFKASGPVTLAYRLPVDLLDCTARAQMRAKVNSAEPVLAFSSALGGGITLVPAEAKTLLAFTEAQTAGLKAGMYVMDMELVTPHGEVLATNVFEVEVTEEVTRD